MELQFITDASGVKQSVVLPFAYWQANVVEGTDFMSYLEIGLAQVRAIETAKLVERTFEELQNEE